MPRFFFHVRHVDSVPDLEGSELVDIHAAQTEAVSLAGGVLRDIGSSFWDHPAWSLEVAGEHGATLFVLRLSVEKAPALLG